MIVKTLKYKTAYVILAMSNASGFHHIVYVVKLSSYNIKFYLVFSGLAMQCGYLYVQRNKSGAIPAYCW